MRGPLASLILIAALLPEDLSAEPLRITGRVLLPADAADVRIELLPQELRFEDGARAVEGKPVAPLATATRNPDGKYELQAPGPGFYRIRIEAKGFLPLEQFLPSLTQDIELDAAAPPRAASLRTRVFDPAGLSPPGVRVFVISSSSLPQDEDDSRWYYAPRETVTDETGRALLLHRKGETWASSASAGCPPAPITRRSRPRDSHRPKPGPSCRRVEPSTSRSPWNANDSQSQSTSKFLIRGVA